jgi:hypothetical protein
MCLAASKEIVGGVRLQFEEYVPDSEIAVRSVRQIAIIAFL